ncbi:hypothetical protein ACWGH8_40115 [Nonomuraea muscovyensis]|uniref:Uncharacterized protein n=1 Tax=Nonomuraea muscovyensis TaxID=1124761 RepID=A0A7X0EZQ5_9ACTN|nr:hypothetical protein [Nonomuraea muscovyensis]MBB6346955.1 hypothetical protein [Nonomuraea muscovyensis]
MTADRHRPGYVRRRVGRALLAYGVALLAGAAVLAVWWLTR